MSLNDVKGASYVWTSHISKDSKYNLNVYVRANKIDIQIDRQRDRLCSTNW